MNHRELVSHIAERLDVSQKSVSDVLAALGDAIVSELRAGKMLRVSGVGTFVISKRAARMAVNPRTGAPVSVRAKKVPVLVVSTVLGDRVM